MPAVNWTSFDDDGDDDGSFDLVGNAEVSGQISVDIVRGINNQWSVYLGNQRVKTGIVTREEAKKWAEENASLKTLIDYLSE